MSTLSYRPSERRLIPRAYSRAKTPDQSGTPCSQGAERRPSTGCELDGREYGCAGAPKYGQDRKTRVQNHKDARSFDEAAWITVPVTIPGDHASSHTTSAIHVRV